MPISNDIRDREHDKFRGDSTSETRVAVTMEGDTGLLEGVQYDDVQVTYPDSVTENYLYYQSAILQTTIEVTYTSSSKDLLLRARRV